MSIYSQFVQLKHENLSKEKLEALATSLGIMPDDYANRADLLMKIAEVREINSKAIDKS